MAQETEHVLSHRWKQLWQGHPRAQETYLTLTKRHLDRALPYHNLELIVRQLALLVTVRELSQDPRALELAIWYHRAECDARQSDNETESAIFAGEELAKLGMPAIERARVMRLIMAVRFGRIPQGEEECLMVDIVRGVLGSPSAEYAHYSASIREEFPWLDDRAYIAARLAALSEIARSGIFFTEHFRRHYLAQARKNMSIEEIILRAR